jgi:hypothetical protein
MKFIPPLLFVVVMSACVAQPPPVITPVQPNFNRPMAIHTCVPGAVVWLDGANVPLLRGTTDGNGNIEFLVFPSNVAAFNLHATSDKFPEYGAVITTKPSNEPLIIILGSCAK